MAAYCLSGYPAPCYFLRLKAASNSKFILRSFKKIKLRKTSKEGAMRILLLTLAVLTANVALSNPPTPPSSGMNLKLIGAEIYVDKDDGNKFRWFDQNGNSCDPPQKVCSVTFVSIYSKRGIAI